MLTNVEESTVWVPNGVPIQNPCRSVTSGLSSGSGGSVVFVDHTAEYAVASDRAVYWHGGWLVVVVGGALVESLMRASVVLAPPLPPGDFHPQLIAHAGRTQEPPAAAYPTTVEASSAADRTTTLHAP
jgi:hypothetical protein